ncbi:MAG: molybdopterin-binding protein [Kiritimatiellia bacterium]|jgi:molybdopterin-biosynthesis enzyme MoeA-like protein|nr:molybdopterin-binding protein [Kiritimatiellia bacterium]MDP6630528.1 molybdopterin-binding protein [Kiritimatiellia bacterium]MDP6811202.1 molybdopterin-binding protein [Kiritimatiellia bacterium]MDP7024353.1 molybdopterin-binding protein [Kiritimatiellia bacterium]
MTREAIEKVGLIIVGDEILNGRRQDKHFQYTMDLLHEWKLGLAYALVLPDDMDALVTHFTWAMAQPCPFFSCGGIGSTPDDITRQAAAAAAGVGLEQHAEARQILIDRYGAEATEPRLRMVTFPIGCTLVPNPVNQVPGFGLANGYFLPGFPSMAAPMMRWILETYYEPGAEKVRFTMALPNTREADLADLMETFVADYTDLTFSSLPQHTDAGPRVILSISGIPERAEGAYADLKQRLRDVPVTFEENAS